MKVLFVSPTEVTSPNGISKTIRELAGNLSRSGHSVVVLQPGSPGLPAEGSLDGFKVVRARSLAAKYLYGLNAGLLRHLARLVGEMSPDIVHVHGYHWLLAIEAICYLKLKKARIVFSPHYMPTGHNTLAGRYLWGFYNLAGKACLKDIGRVTCASQYERDSVMADLGVPDGKISVIRHGVGSIPGKPAAEKGSSIRLLFVGSLIELKGVQHVLRVAHELKFSLGRDVRLIIVGSGPCEGGLRKLSSRLNLDRYVRWYSGLGQGELDELYAEADVFLLLSRSENYGIVVAESLSKGTPAIVSGITALKEFTSISGCFGVDYPPDPKKVAELAARIADGGITVDRHSDQLHTWDEVSRDYERVFFEIVSGRQMPGIRP